MKWTPAFKNGRRILIPPKFFRTGPRCKCGHLRRVHDIMTGKCRYCQCTSLPR